MALLSSVTVPFFLPLVFTLSLYQGLVMEVINVMLILLVISWMLVVLWVKESGLPERHVQVSFLMSLRNLGTQRRGDGKDCAPLPPKEWGEMGVPHNLFPRLGVG